MFFVGELPNIQRTIIPGFGPDVKAMGSRKLQLGKAQLGNGHGLFNGS